MLLALSTTALGCGDGRAVAPLDASSAAQPTNTGAGTSPGGPPDVLTADQAAKQAARGPSIAVIAVDVPLSSSLPMGGVAGRDGDGYPTQFVDRAAFRSLLAKGYYAALNRFFDELQAAFEGDNRKEYWPTGAADAFASTDPKLRSALDRWAAKTPDHFAPLLARATHFDAVASAARGADWAAKTSASQLAGMVDAHTSARRDLAQALARKPTLVAAHRLLIRMAMADSDADPRASFEQAIATCPACFQVRVTFVHALSRRWHGGSAEMRAFALSAPVAANPRLRFLPGFADLDRARDLADAQQYPEAVAAVDHACALGEFWVFLAERAKVLASSGDLRAALSDLDRAIVLAPGEFELLFQRVRLRLQRKEPEAASTDLVAALRHEPADKEAQALTVRVIKAIVYAGWEHEQAGRRTDALRLFDRALQLSPGDADIVRRRARVAGGGGR